MNPQYYPAVYDRQGQPTEVWLIGDDGKTLRGKWPIDVFIGIYGKPEDVNLLIRRLDVPGHGSR